MAGVGPSSGGAAAGGAPLRGQQLLYSCVARGTTILAEHAAAAGNAALIAVRILEQLPTEDTRVTYAQDRHQFHVLVSDGGLVLLVMAEDGAGRRVPYAFLDDARAAFLAQFGGNGGDDGGGSGGGGASSSYWRTMPAYAANDAFSGALRERMARFSDPRADTLTRVRGEITQVKDVMIENISKVLDRGERLDLLVDKTELLTGEALAFRREAKRARRVLWLKDVQMYFVIGGIVALVVLFLVLMFRNSIK